MAVGTTYFLRAAEAVDIAGRLKPLLICVAALKSSGGFDKVGCTRVCEASFRAGAAEKLKVDNAWMKYCRGIASGNHFDRIVIISNVKFSALLYTGPEPLLFPSAKLQED